MTESNDTADTSSFVDGVPSFEKERQDPIAEIGDDGYLHHYTDAAGIIGILTPATYHTGAHLPEECEQRTIKGDSPVPAGPANKIEFPCLRATNVRFLNDHMELRLVFDLAKDALRAFKTQSLSLEPDKRKLEVEVIDEALRAIDDDPQDADVYVCSLSAHANNLSQWRSYGKGIGGYSVGFRMSLLRKLVAMQQGFSIQPCIYKPNLQRQAVHEIVHRTIQTLRNQIDSAGPGSDIVSKVFRHFHHASLLTSLKWIGALMKDQGFEVEREFRLIHIPEHRHGSGQYNPKVQFRPTAIGVAPFVQFRLKERSTDRLQGCQVWVGPSLESGASEAAIRRFMQSENIDGDVFPSSIPYRAMT